MKSRKARVQHRVISAAEARELMAVAMSEEELQNKVRATAVQCGFMFYHTNRSQRSEVGYPDCTMVRRRGQQLEIIFAELKREGKDPTGEQAAWLSTIGVSACENVSVRACVWRPSDLLSGRIAKELR